LWENVIALEEQPTALEEQAMALGPTDLPFQSRGVEKATAVMKRCNTDVYVLYCLHNISTADTELLEFQCHFLLQLCFSFWSSLLPRSRLVVMD
jgi:hypothetical protein